MKPRLAWSFLVLCFCLVPSQAYSEEQQPLSQIEPQIVRLSYMEGDVRISRDKQEGQAKRADWEKAVAGLPLESGFSLATGAGRAEIELEDASVLYLAENSVLVFTDVHTLLDMPQTELALLTGTVTLHVRPFVPGERFTLRTPTDTLNLSYGRENQVRVTAYMDATAITPLVDAPIQEGSLGTATALGAGQTVFYRSGHRVAFIGPAYTAAMTAWDQWVASRYAQRSIAMRNMMKQSGLEEPVPGLDQLEGHGQFVDCAPYGKCWEPSPDAEPNHTPATGAALATEKGAAAAPAPPSAQPAMALSTEASQTNPKAVQSAIPSFVQTTPAKPAKNALLPSPYGADTYAYFPCDPYSFYYRYRPANWNGAWYDPYPWNWALCHSGTWIYNQNRYLWVPGHKRHHQPPVRWVKWHGKTAYVPIHPSDQKGKSPLNAPHGLFPVRGKPGPGGERLIMKPGGEPTLLGSPPKTFLKGYSLPLARAEAPRMEAHMLQPPLGDRSTHPFAATAPILFDHRSQSFLMSHQVHEGSNTRTVTEPVGSYLAHDGVAGFGGPGAFHNAGPRGPSSFNGGAGAGNSAGSFHGGGVFTGSGPRNGGNSGGFSGGGSASHSGGSFSSGGGGGSHSSGSFSGGGGGGGHSGGGFSGGGGGLSGGGGGGGHSGGGGSSGGGSSGGGGGHH